MDKYLRRPTAETIVQKARYEQYNLQENPFPASPFVNPESSDARSNGNIYEPSIRQEEYSIIEQNFLAVPQNDFNHLRLGYIIDTSYIGRGNGKSAFLINVQRRINKDFAYSVSSGLNKCFALTLVPEPGGKTKTFESFVDLFANGIFRCGIIDDSLTSLRLAAIIALYPKFDVAKQFPDEQELRLKLSTDKWYSENNIDFRQITQHLASSSHLRNIPKEFPIYSMGPLLSQVSTQKDFIDYYRSLKRGKPRFEFIFSHLVSLFLAAGFNGAYVFVDDFERIPDFQSERQKRDFALELRTCLFDGVYTNARVGFYNVLLVLHAGVPRLIQSAWDQSGLEQRSPIFFKGTPKNIIRFEKITLESAFSLIKKYLQAYRTKDTINSFDPFTKEAVSKIAELSEFNASKILKMAYEVLEKAVDSKSSVIDESFVLDSDDVIPSEQRQTGGIHDAPTKDLMQESE